MSDTISVSAEGTTDSGRLSNQKEQEPGIDSWSVRMADSCMKRRPILADGWSYEVGDLDSGPLPLPWRAETAREAEEKLKASYDDTIWAITVIEED